MPATKGIPLSDAVPQLVQALAYYGEDDVWRWFERHQRMTGHYPNVYQSTIEDCRYFRKVPNEPFREPYLRVSKPEGKMIPHGGSKGWEPEWVGLFRDELLRVRKRKEKVGPKKLECTRITDYLRDALGVREHKDGEGNVTLQWLIQYELAEVLCKTLGLQPRTVGI